MAINFRKLNSQIHPFKPEVNTGYIFIATEEQKNNFLCSVSKIGSKRSLIKSLMILIHSDEYFKQEFTL